MIELDFSNKINGYYLYGVSSIDQGSSYSKSMPVMFGDTLELLLVEMVLLFSCLLPISFNPDLIIPNPLLLMIDVGGTTFTGSS